MRLRQQENIRKDSLGDIGGEIQKLTTWTLDVEALSKVKDINFPTVSLEKIEARCRQKEKDLEDLRRALLRLDSFIFRKVQDILQVKTEQEQHNNEEGEEEDSNSGDGISKEFIHAAYSVLFDNRCRREYILCCDSLDSFKSLLGHLYCQAKVKGLLKSVDVPVPFFEYYLREKISLKDWIEYYNSIYIKDRWLMSLLKVGTSQDMFLWMVLFEKCLKKQVSYLLDDVNVLLKVLFRFV
jgi:hypothetical protein